MEIEEIYEKAHTFVKEKFPDLRSGEERITILSIMKMHVELERIKQTAQMLEKAEGFKKILLDTE